MSQKVKLKSIIFFLSILSLRSVLSTLYVMSDLSDLYCSCQMTPQMTCLTSLNGHICNWKFEVVHLQVRGCLQLAHTSMLDRKLFDQMC